jgi:predicted enzyme related to lactoylglutathione lyase
VSNLAAIALEAATGTPNQPEVTMKLDLLTPAVEIGLVTTNLDAMVAFYEGFLGLEPQGEIEFADGSQRRYTLGASVIKLVTYTTPPAQPPTPGGGRAQAGLRYFTIGIQNLRDAAAQIEAAGYQIVEPPTEFAPVPGMGWMFIADPDGNSIELFGTL